MIGDPNPSSNDYDIKLMVRSLRLAFRFMASDYDRREFSRNMTEIYLDESRFTMGCLKTYIEHQFSSAADPELTKSAYFTPSTRASSCSNASPSSARPTQTRIPRTSTPCTAVGSPRSPRTRAPPTLEASKRAAGSWSAPF